MAANVDARSARTIMRNAAQPSAPMRPAAVYCFLGASNRIANAKVPMNAASVCQPSPAVSGLTVMPPRSMMPPAIQPSSMNAILTPMAMQKKPSIASVSLVRPAI